MCCDLPVLKTCCCISMRHGLLVCAAFKVLFSSVLIIVISVATVSLVQRAIMDNLTIGYSLEWLGIGTALIIAIIDVIMNAFVIIVASCLKGKARLLKKYYFHCKFIVVVIFLCNTTILNFLDSIANSDPDMCPLDDMPVRCTVRQLLEILFYLAFAAFHVFILLLVRSEILRLDSLSKSANNTPDTEANLDTSSNIENYK